MRRYDVSKRLEIGNMVEYLRQFRETRSKMSIKEETEGHF
jgi:hypothetical protein